MKTARLLLVVSYDETKTNPDDVRCKFSRMVENACDLGDEEPDAEGISFGEFELLED